MKSGLKKTLLASVLLSTGISAGTASFIKDHDKGDVSSPSFSTFSHYGDYADEGERTNAFIPYSYTTISFNEEAENNKVEFATKQKSLFSTPIPYSEVDEKAITLEDIPDWVLSTLEALSPVSDILDDIPSITSPDDINNLPSTDFGQDVIEWGEFNAAFNNHLYWEYEAGMEDTLNLSLSSHPSTDLEAGLDITNEATWTDYVILPTFWILSSLDATEVGDAIYAEATTFWEDTKFVLEKAPSEATFDPIVLYDTITTEQIESIDGYFEHDVAPIDIKTIDSTHTSVDDVYTSDYEFFSKSDLNFTPISSIYDVTLGEGGTTIGDLTIFGVSIFDEAFDSSQIATAFSDQVWTKIEAAIDAAIDPTTLAPLNAAVKEEVHNNLDTPINDAATTIATAVQNLVDKVAALEGVIDSMNAAIDSLNAAVAQYNSAIDAINTVVWGLDYIVLTEENYINEQIVLYNNSTDTEVTNIEGFVAEVNVAIEAVNSIIGEVAVDDNGNGVIDAGEEGTGINGLLSELVFDINEQINSVFGSINTYVEYVNTSYAYEIYNLLFVTFYEVSREYVEENMHTIPPNWEIDLDGKLSNNYEDTVNPHRNGDNTLTTDYEKLTTAPSGEHLTNEFTEVSVTPTGGSEIEVADSTNPSLTQVDAPTYDLTYTVAVREGNDYVDFASDAITIYAIESTYDSTTSTWIENTTPIELTYTVDGGTELETASTDAATGAVYNLVQYAYTVEGLNAGSKYEIYMEANSISGYESYFDGFSNATRVSAYPIIHYENNDVTLDPTSVEIGTVDSTASFTVRDALTVWDIDQEDVTFTVTTADGLTDVSSLFTFDAWTDDYSGETTFTLHADSGLTPNTSYITSIFVNNTYSSIDETELTTGPVLQWGGGTAEGEEGFWTTQNWLDPYPPEITTVTITQPDWSNDDPTGVSGDRKHEATIDFGVTIPTNDELLGEDGAVVTDVNLYFASNEDGTVTYTPGSDNSALLVPELSGDYGYTTQYSGLELEAGTYTGTFELDGLKLGSDYSFVIEIDYHGKNLILEEPTNAYYVTSLDDNSADGGLPPYDISFTTEGLDPANAPFFTDGIGFVIGEEPATTTTTWTTTFSIVDPATVVDTTNTVLQDPEFQIGTTSGSLTLATPDTDYDLVWDDPTAWANRADDNLTDVTYTGTVTFKNLIPNTEYYATMGINSNYWVDATVQNVDEWDLSTTPIYSDEINDKTLKEEALPPIWPSSTDEALLFTDWTPTTLDYDFKFLVPVDDDIHKNTVFDNLNVYLGPGGEGTLTQIDEFVGTELPDPEDTTYGYNPAYVIEYTAEGETQETVESQSYNVYEGTVKFLGLEANTNYDMQLGIVTHSFDDDAEAPGTGTMAEVKSPIVNHDTKKFPARDPWWDATTDIAFIESVVTNPNTDEQLMTATISYNFWLPTVDDSYFDTILTDLPVYLTHGTDVVPVVKDEDYYITEEKSGETVDGVGDNYTGTITFVDLLPEETYKVQLGIVTDSSNDIDADAYVPAEVLSSELEFDTELFPAKPPYFGDEDKENGFSYKEFSDTTITYEFDFTIPVDEHGYYPTNLNAINVYIAEDSSATTGDEEWTLLTESVDYFFTWETTAPDISTRGTVKGEITYKNLNPATTYHYMLGLDTDYYLEVYSPIMVHATAFAVATEPTIEIPDGEVVYYYGDDEGENAKANGWYIDFSVITGNDPDDGKADTLIKTINVGTYDTGMADVDSTQEEMKAALITSDYYMNEYVITGAPDNSEGVTQVDFSRMLKSTTLDFASTFDDMIISVEWGDDGTSYEEASGTVYAIVPEFTTPDLDIINPAFEQAYLSETTTNSATFNYSIGLLNPDGLYPDSNAEDFDRDAAEWQDESEDWQANPYISRLYVEGSEGTIVEGTSSSSSTKGGEVLFYEEEAPSMSGSFTLTGLNWGCAYTDLTLYADFDSYKESDLEGGAPIDSATPLDGGSGTFEIDLEEFETDSYVPDPDFLVDPDEPDEWDLITPEIPTIEPEKPDVTDPDEGSDQDHKSLAWWIFLLLIIIFTGATLAIVIYPMIKEN